MLIEYKLSKSEQESALKFIEAHKDCCMKKYGRQLVSPSGGNYSYTFTPTGIGTCTSIRCNVCKQIEDITDFSLW